MPTHWESSKRPLFVRTVVVNGSRHAILTQEDPFAQHLTSNNKSNRPDSGHSSISSRSEIFQEPTVTVKGNPKASKDLQSCLVKLRVVLTQQDARRPTRENKRQKIPIRNKKRRRKGDANIKEVDEKTESIQPEETPIQNTDRNNNNAVASFFASEHHRVPHYTIHDDDEQVERISGTSQYLLPDQGYGTSSTIGISSEYDLPWNTISSDSYFTRPFYNRLSERVMQWMDLANRTKKPTIHEKPIPRKPIERNECKEKTPRSNRASSEDNNDEVRVDEDIDTALSREFPRFTQDLNHLHILRSIPVKQDAYTTQLKESIAHNFAHVVSIRSGKYAHEEDLKPPLKRQAKVEEIVEPEDDPLPLLPDKFQVNENLKPFSGTYLEKTRSLTTLVNRLPWLRDNKVIVNSRDRDFGKPQLHIFIPALPTQQTESEQTWSDSDSTNSDI